MKWLAHYRLTKYTKWHLYIKGEIVATVDHPFEDAKKRFPGKEVKQHSSVNIDVKA